MAQRVVEEVEEHNVSIGQLKKISKQPPKLDGRPGTDGYSPNQLVVLLEYFRSCSCSEGFSPGTQTFIPVDAEGQ